MQDRIEKLFSALPNTDQKALHALSDELQPSAQEQKFELFFDLFLSFFARLVRVQATGEGRPKDMALAAKLIGEARLATFAEVWETTVREKADTLALNLDRKSLILETVSRLEAAARS